MKLTEKQKYIVKVNEYISNKKVAILSSAGSGKSTTLVERVKYLLTKGVRQNQIKIFSFSRTASNEIIKRLSNFNEITISTIHSFCYHLIRNNSSYFKINNIKIFSDNQLYSTIKSFVSSYYDYNITSAKLNGISQDIMNKMRKIKKALEYEDINHVEKEIIMSIEEWKEKNNLYTFDDLLYIVYRGLLNNEELRKKYMFEYVFLDENQDSNKIQIKLIELLINENTTIMCFQDIQQTLYRFNYADPFYLMEFFDNNGFDIIQMNETFRFGKQISAIADLVVDRMDIDDKYKIKTETKMNGVNVDLHSSYSHRDILLYDLINNKEPLHNHNILCRTNKALLNIQEFLEKNGIPCYNQSGNFLDRSEIKFLFSIIELFNVFNLDEFIYISNKLKIGIDKILITRASQEFKGGTIIDFIDNVLETKIEGIGDVRRNKLRNLYSTLIEIQGMIVDNTENIFHKVAEKIDINSLDFMIDEINDDGINNRVERWEFINFLDDRMIDNKFDNVFDFINFLKTQFGYERKEVKNKVILRTIHSSKGMTLPIVYLCLDEFCNPHFVKTEDDFLDELFCCYVGITRARDKLHILLDMPINHKLGFLYGYETQNIEETVSENNIYSVLDTEYYNNNCNTCRIEVTNIVSIKVQTEKAIGFVVDGNESIVWIPKRYIGFKDGKVYTTKWLFNKIAI